jgi:LmbE family N-acetylglucosaminyl deacetylase
MNRILVLAPHIDDESLGCGATIARLSEEGRDCRVVAFSKAVVSLLPPHTEESVTQEFFNALKILGVKGQIFNYPTRDFDLNRQDILDSMILMREDYDPDLIICPALSDMHQDHQIVAQEACRAFWDRSILGFESIRKCKKFDAKVYAPVSLEHVTKKLEAVQCYGSQMDKDFFPGQPNVVMSQARLRGLQCGTNMAEAFECLQLMV